LGYAKKLQEKFPGVVKTIVIPDQYGRISATQMRQTIKDGDFEEFLKFIPIPAYNKGYAKEVFGLLTKILK
jgi:hypothetical protein